MFSNKELLQERINELDNVILNYKNNKINIFSFTTKDRMLDCFINSNFCFSSQGIYEKNDINFENIKASANIITTDITGEINLIDAKNKHTFTSKEDAIIFINSPLDLVVEAIDTIEEKTDTAILENVEYSEDILEDFSVLETLDNLYTSIDYDKILAIDFETANEFHDKACSVGIAIYENGEITVSKEFLINPETYFNQMNINIHGLTQSMVKDAPTFPTIWKRIFDMIDNRTLVIAHNAAFDIRLLQKLISIYKSEYKDFDYLCTQNLYRSNIKLDAYNLKAVGTYIGETFEHHRAVDDSLICLKAFLHIVNTERLFNRTLIESELRTSVSRFTMTDETKSYTARAKKQNFNKFSSNSFKAKDLKPKSTDFDESHPVFGKMFTFTGDFTTFASKEEAAQRIVDLGGVFKDGLVKANNYLVRGINLNTGLPMDGGKVQKVADYNNKGCEIQIISEFELMNLLSVKSATETSIEPQVTEETIKDLEAKTVVVIEPKIEDSIISVNLEEIISNSSDSEVVIEINQTIEPPIVPSIDISQRDTTAVVETVDTNIPKPTSTFKPRSSNTQLSMFDLMMGAKESNQHAEVAMTDLSTNEPIKKETLVESLTKATNFTLIAPKGEFFKFETESEKLEKLKQYKLIPAKSITFDKPIYYKGVYSDEAIRCDIVGYLDLDILILNINDKLHSIRGEYLKQMQDANFSIFEA